MMKENNMEWSFEGQMEVAQAIANQWGERLTLHHFDSEITLHL